MTRAYIRVDPGFYERKVFEDRYPLPAVTALVGCLCLAEMQPVRGRFRDLSVLRALLGRGSRWTAYLIEQGDLIVQDGGSVYIDGWDEWQEGDVTVKERMERIRNRRRVTPATVSPPSKAESGAGRIGGAGQPGRYADAYKAFAQLQGHKPDATEQRWMDDLAKDFTCEGVARSLYEDRDPAAPGLLGRVSKKLRNGAAA
jgi:hypothetical protein